MRVEATGPGRVFRGWARNRIGRGTVAGGGPVVVAGPGRPDDDRWLKMAPTQAYQNAHAAQLARPKAAVARRARYPRERVQSCSMSGIGFVNCAS
jgi:hypothetical protein